MDEGFEDWYRKQHPRLISAVYAACGDADVAEDAVDEAFARALDRWDRVQGMTSPEAWTARVAINVMRRRLRRRAMEGRLLARRSVGEDRSTAAPGSNPEVWAAVRTLPERQRLAVVLRYVGDFTEDATAAAMGVTRGTVAASMAAARGRLAADLVDLGPGGGGDGAAGPDADADADGDSAGREASARATSPMDHPERKKEAPHG